MFFLLKLLNLSERIEDIIPIVVSIIKKNNDENKDFPYLSKKAQEVFKNIIGLEMLENWRM